MKKITQFLKSKRNFESIFRLVGSSYIIVSSLIFIAEIIIRTNNPESVFFKNPIVVFVDNYHFLIVGVWFFFSIVIIFYGNYITARRMYHLTQKMQGHAEEAMQIFINRNEPKDEQEQS